MIDIMILAIGLSVSIVLGFVFAISRFKGSDWLILMSIGFMIFFLVLMYISEEQIMENRDLECAAAGYDEMSNLENNIDGDFMLCKKIVGNELVTGWVRYQK